jgi:hypothetical protein
MLVLVFTSDLCVEGNCLIKFGFLAVTKENEEEKNLKCFSLYLSIAAKTQAIASRLDAGISFLIQT